MKDHNYTVSPAAKQGLLDLFATAVKPHRSTLYMRRPAGHIDAFGTPVFNDTYQSTHVEGLSHALVQLARASDFSDWLPNPSIPMYLTHPGTAKLFYNPPDLLYLRDVQEDGTPWLELLEWQRQDYLKELQRVHGWRASTDSEQDYSSSSSAPNSKIVAGYSNLNLSLPNDIRRYYHNLRLFHHIPLLPGCRRPNSLTTSVGVVLEALGTGHLYPDGAYLQLIAEPNPRKAYAAKQSSHTRHTRTYGNHAHTPYIQKEWRALPHISKFTQADVDYCVQPENQAHYLDLALEACQLNPILILPPSATIATTLSSTTPPVSDDIPSRTKPHIDLVPASKPQPSATNTYYYKGRDVTAYVLEAYSRHYTHTPPETFPALMPLATRAQLPLYMLQRLATREYVRRLDAASQE